MTSLQWLAFLILFYWTAAAWVLEFIQNRFKRRNVYCESTLNVMIYSDVIKN